MTGLTDQQLSNDPGGDRWERLLDGLGVVQIGERATITGHDLADKVAIRSGERAAAEVLDRL